jgi:DNA-binding Lrp family transcriptional regulator
MDRVDRQIVHCLQRDGRAPFDRIADVLGVSAQTVARRYEALRRDGVIKVTTVPNPRTSPNHTWFVRVVVAPRFAREIADSLAARGDVSWVSLVGGGGEITCVCQIDPQESSERNLLDVLARTAQVQAVSAAAMMRMFLGGNAEWDAFADPLSDQQLLMLDRAARGDLREVGARPVELRPDDEPLLAELARDGRAKPAGLARALGWPRSRVSARLNELFTVGLLVTDVDIATGYFGSATAAYIWMTVAPGQLEKTGLALAARPETAFAAAVTGPANLMCAVSCPDMEALFSYVTTVIGRQPAVHSVDVTPIFRRIKRAHTHMRHGRQSG